MPLCNSGCIYHVHALLKDKTQTLLGLGYGGDVIINSSGPSSYFLVCSWRLIRCSLYFPGNFIQPMDLVKKLLICSIQTSSLPVNGKPFYKPWVSYFIFKNLVTSLRSFVELH